MDYNYIIQKMKGVLSMESIIGKVFEDMEVVEFTRKTKNHVKMFKVRCIKCGHEKELQYSRIKSLTNTSHNNSVCGTYLVEYDNNIGLTVNDYTITEFVKSTKQGYRYKAKCNICGIEFETYISNFKRGHGTKHSECTNHIPKDKYIKRFRKIYSCMRYRTCNENYAEYKYYGGRGISSEYFKDFIVFYKEMYDSYKKHVDEYGEKDTSLDRIDTNGNYDFYNCRWATAKEQANNTRKKQ